MGKIFVIAGLLLAGCSEIGRELEDIHPFATDVLYELMDTPSEISSGVLEARIRQLTADRAEQEETLRFLIFYAVFGLVTPEKVYYIYDVNYDLKRIETRTRGLGGEAVFQINPALWPALDTTEVPAVGAPITDIEDYIDAGSRPSL